MRLIAAAVQNVVKPAVLRGLLAWERRESGVAYDFTSEEVKTDPYPTYRTMRTPDPVHRMRTIDAWALTRYRDVEAMLRDHTRFANADRVLVQTISMSLLELDPPAHTRLRLLVSKAFTPRAVARLQGRIQQITDELLDAASGMERFDLVEALAYPLPVTVIAEMLGVRPRDLDLFKRWSNTLALTVNAILTPDEIRAIMQAADEAHAYFETIIEDRRRQPRDDLVSALLAAEEEGDRLTHDEMLAVLLLLLVAGNDTTRNLIGNGMLALLRNPGELRRLREDPGLIVSAVDELLRYDSPIQLDDRTAREDVEIGGKSIRAGKRVVAILGAANRDPEVFDDPDTVDIGRDVKSHHLAFGRGIHYCLGASLAVLEARIAFASLLERFPSIRLAAAPCYRDSAALRGLDHLWIEVERA